jgi:hypothetical protein
MKEARCKYAWRGVQRAEYRIIHTVKRKEQALDNNCGQFLVRKREVEWNLDILFPDVWFFPILRSIVVFPE